MITKNDINEVLREFWDDEFIKLWWGLKLPGLGKDTPNEAFDKDPQHVLDYVEAYRAD